MKRLLLLAAFLASLAPAFAQGIPATANLTAQDSGACTTANACLTLNIAPNMASSVIQLSGTWSGTVQFEASTTQSTGFSAILGTAVGSTSTATSSTTSGAWRFNVASVNYIRVRVSAYSSGTIVAAITASNASSAQGSGSGSGSCATVGGDLSGSCASAEVIGIETQPWPTIAGQTGYLGVTAGVPVILSSSGLTNPMTTLCDTIYGGAGGTPTRLPCPTTPSGVTQEYVSNPSISGGVEFWTPSGIANDGQSSNYSVAASDCNNRLVFTGTSSIAVTLPTATSLGVSQCAIRISNNTTGAGTTVTITPSSGWTIGLQQYATYTVYQKQWVGLTVNGTNWDVDASQGITGPAYSVLAFGAKCDDATDDTAAIQAAINAASAFNSLGTTGTTGASVVFPPGACLISHAGTNPDGSRYGLHIVNRGIKFVAQTGNWYATQLKYTSTPGTGVWDAAVQLGDPKEAIITSISRSGNIVTANFASMSPAFVAATGSGGANTVVVQGVTGGSTSFDGTFPISTAGATSATWTQTGANESGTVSSTSLIIDSPDNALEYDGTGGHFFDDGVTVECAGTASVTLGNGAGSYVPRVMAFVDNRSGYVNMRNNRPGQNCQYGFLGYQSQLDYFDNLTPEYNSVGIYLGPRSDNAHIMKEWGQGDDTGIWQNGVATLDIQSTNGADCGPSTYWLLVNETAPSSAPPYLVGSTWRRPNYGTFVHWNWNEAEAPNACLAVIGAGVSGGVAETTAYGTFEIEVNGETLQNFAPAEASFIDVGNADHIHLHGMGGFLNQMTNGLFNIVGGTCYATDLTLDGAMSQQAWNFLKNSTPCTGTAPVAYWFRESQGQYQVYASNGTNGQTIYQLLPGFLTLTGLGSTNQANFVADSGGTSAVSSYEWEQGGTLDWRFSDQSSPSKSLQILDHLNSDFVRFGLTQTGAIEINALGSSTSINFNGRANSSTASINFWSGGASPSINAAISSGGFISGYQIDQTQAGKYANTCTLGTNCTITFATAYNSTPVCVANDQTGQHPVQPTPSTTGVTFAGTGTDVVAWACFGNPN